MTLPQSEFLDQGHIRTVCTRVQFAADECPQGSIYGFASAYTPLLDQPVEGPVILRCSDHPLPDLVMAAQRARRRGRGRPDRHSQRGHPDDVRTHSRPADQQIHPDPAGRRQGPARQLDQPLRTHDPATVQMDGQNGAKCDHKPQIKNSCATSLAEEAVAKSVLRKEGG